MEALLLLILLLAFCGILAWAFRRGPEPKYLRHRWIEREIIAATRRGPP